MLSIKKSFSLSLLGSALLASFSFNGMAADTSAIAGASVERIHGEQQQMDFSQQKRVTALHIAQQYQQLKPLLATQITSENKSLNLQALNQSKKLDLSEFKQFQSSVVRAKGYAVNTDDLVEIRLADDSMLEALQNGVAPLFAFEPAGDEKQWQYIEAFDSEGDTHLLDVHNLPKRPVMVVDINAKSDLKAGLGLMREVFAAFSGTTVTSLKSEKNVNSALTQTASADVLETSVLKKVSLKDDEEPWISGDAEVYAVVNGVSAERVEPVLDVVDMPYLDDDGKDYYPNQIMMYWDRYRWSAADMIIMEHDDNTNYKDLALALVNAADVILKSIPDPTVQGYAVIPQITSALIKAMPDDWFSNDDDYVDVFYTILKDQTYTNHYGASGNAKMTLAPLSINAN